MLQFRDWSLKSLSSDASRRLALGGISAALVAVLVLVLLPRPVSASESQEEKDTSASVELAGAFPRPAAQDTGTGVWVWNRGRRAYYLTGNSGPGQKGFASIQAYDLDSREAADPVPLSPRALGGHGTSGLGHRATVEVDEAGGRLFVAYNSPWYQPPVWFQDGVTSASPDGTVARGETCVAASGVRAGGCVGGVMVLDAASLERVGPLMPLRVTSGAGVPLAAPQLLAMQYSPARGAGDSDKVLLLVTDYVLHTTPTGAEGPNVNARVYAGHSPAYVVQMDMASGRQDWVVQVDACRGTRDPSNFDDWQLTRNRPHPGAVYRRASLTDPMVVVACHSGSTQIGALVRIPLDAHGMPAALPLSVAEPGAVADDVAANGPGASPQTWVVQAASPQVTVGPDKVWEMIADPASDRVLLKVVSGPSEQLAEVWWVFDVAMGTFAGTIGIGPATLSSSNAVLDTVRGRLYVMAAPQSSRGFAGGLFMADIRRTPIPQALVFPDAADWAVDFGGNYVVNMGVAQPAAEGEPAWLLTPEPPQGGQTWQAQYRVVLDRVPVTVDPPDGGFEGRTLDLEEAVGVTGTSLDGAARGYAARALFVGGVEAAARVGPADPVGLVYQCNSGALLPSRDGGVAYMPCGSSEHWFAGFLDAANPVVPTGGMLPGLPEGCVGSSPEVVLGFVGPEGPNVVDGTGARGAAQPVRVDSATAADTEAPVSRCSGTDWSQVGELPVLGGVKLLGGVGEPRVESPWKGRSAECAAGRDDAEGTDGAGGGDAVSGVFSAAVQCEGEESSGFAYVRGNQVGDLAVAEALSSFRIYRDPGRGIVSRVESVARGVDVAGVVRIDTVRGTAESWANGRRWTPPESDQAYEANCDVERTAGTCFRRHLFGVRTPVYSCGPCGDEARAVAGMNRAFGVNGKATLREPDPVLARGADNGFTAAVTKKAEERFSDLVLNNDLMQTVLPTLEIIRYAAANRVPSGGGPRGRQIYQFAGVEVSSSYGISCLLVYDEAAGTCAEVAEPPGSIVVSLADADGKALAGGAFEVRADVDGDGVLGLVDTLLPDGACVTADDGVGTCRFDSLQPGGYLVSQVAAPAGYAKAAEPFVVELASGEARTVAFTNASNMSVIQVSAADEAGGPVAGAVFAVYPDPDADGKIAPDTQPAATCTTGADGTCSMSVPAGSYVLVQTAAPGGLEGIEPVAFTFATGGQTAAVGIVNYPADSDVPQPEPAAAPVYTDPVAVSPPVETVVDYAPPATVDAPRVSLPDAVGGTIVRVIRAPGDALRLLSRDPKQAAAWTAALALFSLALLAVRRRQLLGTLTAAAYGFSGGPPPTLPPPAGLPPHRPSGSGPGGTPGPVPPTSAGPAGSTLAAFHAGGASADGTSAGGATAVLERPRVAGAARAVAENVTARVVVATGSRELAEIVTRKLAASEHCEVLATVDSIPALRSAITDCRPDVVVADLGLLDGADLGLLDGADIGGLLAGLHPPARTVGIVPPGTDPQVLVVAAYRAGVAGLLVANDDMGNGQLAYAVRCVADGKPFYGPTVNAALTGMLVLADPRPETVYLTERELEIARLAARGQRRTIAQTLYISEQTVKVHLGRARRKLGLRGSRDHRALRRRLEELHLFDDDTMT